MVKRNRNPGLKRRREIEGNAYERKYNDAFNRVERSEGSSNVGRFDKQTLIAKALLSAIGCLAYLGLLGYYFRVSQEDPPYPNVIDAELEVNHLTNASLLNQVRANECQSSYVTELENLVMAGCVARTMNWR